MGDMDPELTPLAERLCILIHYVGLHKHDSKFDGKMVEAILVPIDELTLTDAEKNACYFDLERILDAKIDDIDEARDLLIRKGIIG